MGGLPSNINKYIPLSSSNSIRKLSLINYSIITGSGPTVLDLNDPAHVLLDASDLGFSYDVKISSSGIVTRTIKEKDINLKIIVNYATDSYGDYDAGTTVYDALAQFLSLLKVTQWTSTDMDRRGVVARDIPDLVLRWDVPTEVTAQRPDGVLSRYRDVVITDIQWTEIDPQYQGIVVDLTLKPISPWYYRVVKTFSSSSSISANNYYTVDLNNVLNYPYLPEDADIYSPIKYNIKLSTSTSGITGWHNIVIGDMGSNNSEKEAMSFYAPFNSANDVYVGNLRNVPYIVCGVNSMWECLLPGSPTELQLIPEALSAHYYLRFKLDVTAYINAEVELNIPIRN